MAKTKIGHYNMKRFILHIGAPRTGTTTLQKHLFKRSKLHAIFSKKTYKPSAKAVAPGVLDNNPENHNLGKFTSESIYNQIIFNAIKLSINSSLENHAIAIDEGIENALSISPSKHVLLSTERLCDCTASLDGNSTINPGEDMQFGIYTLCERLSKQATQALVTLCLRDPMPYLRSKYIRTYSQRNAKKLRILKPSEYIQKQAKLENSNPGASALTPAMHSEFIKQLQKHAFVKAFGFQELLASDDVFSLMGLQGEEEYAFRDFPRENKLPATKEQEQAIETEIMQALKQYDFYDRIMKAQMFD